MNIGYNFGSGLKAMLGIYNLFDSKDHATFCAKLSEGGMLRNHEETLRRKDGSPVYTMQNVFAVRDAGGRVLQHRGLMTDISGIKVFQTELQRSMGSERLTSSLSASERGLTDTETPGSAPSTASVSPALRRACAPTTSELSTRRAYRFHPHRLTFHAIWLSALCWDYAVGSDLPSCWSLWTTPCGHRSKWWKACFALTPRS
jgi:PAS domain-containing protein